MFEDLQRSRAVAAEEDRIHAEWKSGQRDRTRARRQATRRAWSSWIRANTQQIAMVVVIAAPLVLSWSAMTSYGAQVYGPLGVVLPLLTEAGMVAFSLAIQHARAEHRPLSVLTAGLVLTMVAAATMSALNGAQQSAAHAAVMALVSVSGVLVHQAWTHSRYALSSREERRERRFQRSVSRRAHRIRTRAGQEAPVVIDEHGHAQVQLPPATVTETRSRCTGRRRNVYAAAPSGETSSGADTAVDPVAEALGADISDWLRGDLIAPDAPVEPSPELDGNGAGTPPGTGREHPRSPDGNTPFPDTDHHPPAPPAEQPEEHPVPRAADLRRERDGDAPRSTPGDGAGTPPSPDSSETVPESDSDAAHPASWDWPALVTAFRIAITEDRVNPDSQRNTARVMRCSKQRAADLVRLYQTGKLA